MMTKRLNLGSGTDTRDGWVDVDADSSVDPDIVHDLDEYPWPFTDCEFTRVECSHVFEHLADSLRAFQELRRITVESGQVVWTFPIGHTRFEDMTHTHYWNYNTPEQLCGDREHSHETAVGFTVVDKDVDWRLSCGSSLKEARVRYRIWRDGYGPWLSQVTGLYGEVTAYLVAQ